MQTAREILSRRLGLEGLLVFALMLISCMALTVWFAYCSGFIGPPGQPAPVQTQMEQVWTSLGQDSDSPADPATD